MATKQSKDFSQQRLTIGLDLGDRSRSYCVLENGGSVVTEQRVTTTRKALQVAFGAMPRSRIALETGMHFPLDQSLAQSAKAQAGLTIIRGRAGLVRVLRGNVNPWSVTTS